MKQQKLLRVLEQIGLSDKESEVYLACLSLGPSSVLKLATQAGVKRTSVYAVLDSLKLKGLVTAELRGFKMRYVAASPASLKVLLSNRMAALEQTLPEFLSLYNQGGEGSVIRHYEGLSGIEGLYEELLRAIQPNDYYLVLTDMARWEALDSAFFQDFVRRRAGKMVKLRILSVRSPAAIRRRNEDARTGGNLRILPDTVKVTTNLIITPSYVVFHQLEAPFDAILINNKSVRDLQRQMFQALWQMSTDN